MAPGPMALLFTACLFIQDAPVLPVREGTEIAARINDEFITWKEVEDRLKGKPEKMPEDQFRQARRQTLRLMAEERLIKQAARRNNITAEDKDIDDRIRQLMKLYPSEDEFDAFVRRSGKTKTEFREEKRQEILEGRLYWTLIRKAMAGTDSDGPGLMHDNVCPNEIRRYYEQHAKMYEAVERITFIRIAFKFSTEKEKELKRALAESVLRKLQEGADFKLAALYYTEVRYEGVDFAEKDLKRKDAEGFYSKETVALLFDALKKGEVSGIVEDRGSFNIFQLQDKESRNAEPFEEAQLKIRRYLENEKRTRNRAELVAHLVRQAVLKPADLFEGE